LPAILHVKRAVYPCNPPQLLRLNIFSMSGHYNEIHGIASAINAAAISRDIYFESCVLELVIEDRFTI